MWVVIAMIWGIVASTICIVLPIYETSDLIFSAFRGPKKSAANTSTEESVKSGKETHLELPPAPANKA